MRYMMYGGMVIEIGHSMFDLGQLYINDGQGLHPFIGGSLFIFMVAVGIAWCNTDSREKQYV